MHGVCSQEQKLTIYEVSQALNASHLKCSEMGGAAYALLRY